MVRNFELVEAGGIAMIEIKRVDALGRFEPSGIASVLFGSIA